MEEDKICTSCRIRKPLVEYYKDKNGKDKLTSICKKCNTARCRKYQRAHLESKMISDKKYRAKKRVENPGWRLEESRSYIKKNPEKHKAHLALHREIRNGNIKRLPCGVCGEIKTHGHHPDYNKPLDVIWLCSTHHKRLHLGLITL